MSSLDFPHGNVFLDPAGRRLDQGGATRPDRIDPTRVGGPSLAGMLSPLRARLRPVADGHELTIQPMRPVDALAPFTALSPGSDAGPDRFRANGGSDRLTPLASTLLIGNADPQIAGPGRSLEAIARGAGIPVIDAFRSDRIVVDDFSLARISARSDAGIAAAVRIEGPIEADDAAWIERGLASGVDPLSSELRTVRSMQARPNRTLIVHTRHQRDAMRFVAENLRHFLAAVAGVPLNEVAPPDVGLLVPLFEMTGELAVRPVETDVYATSVDVGVATSPSESPRPAESSLIYDRHSSSWHGE